ncbi:hypothetical protein DAI22_01g289400 [Oryza sativa Japonica Group]|nr:hypothetical protein DAI22_01g289400 [Oryza sativa Japonica Group]
MGLGHITNSSSEVGSCNMSTGITSFRLINLEFSDTHEYVQLFVYQSLVFIVGCRHCSTALERNSHCNVQFVASPNNAIVFTNKKCRLSWEAIHFSRDLLHKHTIGTTTELGQKDGLSACIVSWSSLYSADQRVKTET